MRSARLAKGLSQSALAALAGISRQSVQAIESGSSVPSVEVALRVAAAVDRAIGELFVLRRPEEGRDALVIAGSDDPALELLVDALRSRGGPLVSLSRVGSTDGLKSLVAHSTDLACVHLMDPDGTYTGAAVRAVVGDMPLSRITFARREQGLVYAPGRRFRDVADVVRQGAHFAARKEGSGTRLLLDHELSRAGIPPRRLRGYATQHPRHADVVGAILAGGADVGIALRADAKRFGLGFTSIRWEEISLVGRPELVRSGRTEALRAVLRDRAFRRSIVALGGYDVSRAGRISSVAAAASPS